MNPRQSLEERFLAKVDRRGPDECWLWTGGLNRAGGYGQFGVGRRTVGAHRLAYALANGPIPEGMQVLHRCDQPACVNQSHLFLGTNAENMADKVLKGRGTKAEGENNGQAKLTEADVREIVASAGRGVRGTVIARRLGVCKSAVHCILRGERWAHLTGIEQRRAA